ncbi:MAG: hypothetical protein ACQEP7_01885 [bacterium]
MANRRKRKLINWSIQGRMVGLVVGAVLLTSLVLGSFIWYCIKVIDVLSRQAALRPEFREIISGQLFYFGILVILGILAVLILLILLTIRFSHRLAGPLYRVRQDLEQMRNSGKINVIYIRARDFHQELVRSLNHLLLECRKKIENANPEEE